MNTTKSETPLIFDATKLSRSELEAEVVFQAKLLEQCRAALMWTDELEDEGDRVYFASTNHADYQKNIFHEIKELELERACFPKNGRDLYKVIFELLEALVMIRTCWAGHADECAFAKDYKSECDCDWPKVAAKCDAAIAKARGAT